ncbi:MAG: AAA family ATPase [Leptospiraceae bacterium]|nr:AAA family ATPase [Leptospiraceae bacterium]
MINIENYQDIKEIHSGKNSLVFRALKNGKQYIIKLLNNEYPDAALINRFRNEFNNINKLKSPGLVEAEEFIRYNNTYAIVFKDIDGETIYNLFKKDHNFSIQEIIEIMIKIAQALGNIHIKNAVHNDIKSQNIIYNHKTGILNIIDLGSVSFLNKQYLITPNNTSIEGTLAHISPEQTGRINRSVDYRTDFYSLGVTYYNLLTNQLPFEYKDSISLVHAHIAKKPIPPFELNKTPLALSNIVLKLMEKNPEDRYQTVEGLVWDLEKCKASLEKYGIDYLKRYKFDIATKDFSRKFIISKRLFGRDSELEKIKEKFESSSNGHFEILFVSGRSGIGKSALIHELNRSISESKGFFASGKYDNYKKSIPYRALSRAFQKIIQQILSQSQDSIQGFKDKIQLALGENGQIVTQVIPELEKLIGIQPDSIQLDPAETENRFRLSFLNFVKALCKESHPITIFLDDMQWADNSSIQLLSNIIADPELKYLFIIMAYRDNEINPAMSFYHFMANLKKKGREFNKIDLNPIEVNSIDSLIADTLKTSPEEVHSLSQVVFAKTKGNPFFVNEFLKNLYENKLIYFQKEKWAWNLDKINSLTITENVIDLIIKKISSLTENRLHLLKIAACIGNWFRLDVFLDIVGEDENKVMEELIFLSNEEYIILGENNVNFVHDKIHEAVYTFLTPSEKAKNHKHIGLRYFSMLDKFKLDEHIFTIVNQLNLGELDSKDKQEVTRLIDLNYSAGEKALNSNAYEQANLFFEKAQSLLPANSWEDNYSRNLKIYIGLAKSEYLIKDFTKAESTFNFIIDKAESILDRIQIYEMKSAMYASQNKMSEIIEILKLALRELNYSLPQKPTAVSPLPELIKYKIYLKGKSISELEQLPEMTDLVDLAIMRILNALIAPAFIGQPALFPVIVLKMVNLTLRKGLSPISPLAFAALGMIQGFGLGNFSTGYELGEIGVKLLQKTESKIIKCRVLFFFACMISHWKNHAKDSSKIFIESLQAGFESGELQYASYALNNLHFQGTLRRQKLPELQESFNNYYTSLLSLNQINAIQIYNLDRQFVNNLLGNSKNILQIEGEHFQESKILAEWIEAKNENGLFQYYLSKMRLEYLFGDMNKAFEYSNLCLSYESAVFSMMFIPESVFFRALIAYQLYNKNSKKSFFLNIIKSSAKRLKVWASSSPYNYFHKYQIILGILQACKDKPELAYNHFQHAIDSAKLNEYLLEEALANELWALVLERNQQSKYANVHLLEAHYIYSIWGSKPKVNLLEETNPYFKSYSKRYIKLQQIDTSSPTVTKRSSTTDSSFLDIDTIIKASRTLSGSMKLGNLLERMMTILLENAGADRGFFLLKEKEKWYIQAAGQSQPVKIEVLQSQLFLDNAIRDNKTLDDTFASTVINYVIHSEKIVILHDGANDSTFMNDPYILKSKPKSILCYPIFNHGKLNAVVYLENSLTSDVFNSGRLELLKILAAQISISLENSLLYSNLERKVSERTTNLNKALNDVQQLKEKQDGDYYLTSLLIEPLSKNQANSQNVKIEFLTEQNKKFQFKDFNSEIGGDLSVADRIILHDKNYIVIMNGDAMGKSMQGAGGAIVLGSVFESMVKRNQFDKSSNNLFPEEWLKNAFKELHTVFTTFNGSMLVSIFMGLLDEQTGLLYFITAEHPSPVLFRDNKASFIPSQFNYTKLGMLRTNRKIFINTFELKDQDVIIIGSDGKDDIFISSNSGDMTINEDENLFLENVESSKGNLIDIIRRIKAQGDLMDDISLVRLSYSEALQEDFASTPPLLNSILLSNPNIFKSEYFNQMIKKYINFSINSSSESIQYLYLISLVFRKLKNFQSAIQYSERIRLRDPYNRRNLNLLKNLYRLNGDQMQEGKIAIQIANLKN